MAHTKAKGSSKNGRDSSAKRLGVKRQHGETVNAGEILIRQRGTKYLPGLNVGKSGDDSLYSLKAGTIKFLSKIKIRFDGNRRNVKMVTIEPAK
jgi:large subunit ribosomal protein L27